MRLFRFVDLFVLSLIAIILNYFNASLILKNKWLFFSLDITVVIVFISMFRWGIYGAIAGVFVTLSKVLFSGQTDFETFMVHFFGSITLFLSLLWFKFYDKKKITSNVFLSLLYIISSYLTIFVGECIISLVFGNDFIGILTTKIFTDSLNILIVFAVFLIAIKQKVLVVDMKEYLTEMKE